MEKKFNKIMYIYLFMMVLFVGILIMSSLGIDLGNNYTYLIQILVMCAIPLTFYTLFISKDANKTRKDFGLIKISLKSIIITIFLGVLLYLFNVGIANLFANILYFLGYESLSVSANLSITDSYISNIFLVAVLPGICEEIAHRGLLCNATKNEIGIRKSVIISSLLFGLMHLNIEQFFYASILGALICIAGLCSGSIYTCMILHFMNNFLGITNTYLSEYYSNWTSVNNWLYTLVNNDNMLISILILSTVIAMCIFGTIFCYKLLLKENLQKKINSINDYIENDAKDKSASIKYINQFIQSKQQEMVDETKYKKLSFAEKIPLYASLFLGIMVTFFTFIWGVL